MLTLALQRRYRHIPAGDPWSAHSRSLIHITTVRLKVEENQLVGIFGEIGVLVDGLKGA
jgi:hypothetical protein